MTLSLFHLGRPDNVPTLHRLLLAVDKVPRLVKREAGVDAVGHAVGPHGENIVAGAVLAAGHLVVVLAVTGDPEGLDRVREVAVELEGGLGWGDVVCEVCGRGA